MSDDTVSETDCAICRHLTPANGAELVRHSVVRQLGGELSYDWRSEGVRANLAIPLDRLSR